MTIFTTNPFDDGYFVDGKPVSKFQQFCMRSWERMECEIKVFDYKSPEVIEAKEKCKEWVENALKINHKPIASDAIRLYILSLYPDLLYFDTDVYISDPSVMQTMIGEETFRIRNKNFCIVHNGKRQDIAKKIVEEYYMTGNVMGDRQLISNSEFLSSLPSIPNNSTWEHMPRIENKYYDNIYVESISEIKKYIEERPNRHLCFYFQTPIRGKLYKEGILPFKKLDEKGNTFCDFKYFHKIPDEDFEEFRSFMDN